MATDFPTSSSQQQPFANPQPAPVPTPAASPPTKQSLKSWWKGFRPPAKSQEPNGNRPFKPSRTPSSHFFASVGYRSRIPRNRRTVFQESFMGMDALATDGLPPEEASPASSAREPILRPPTETQSIRLRFLSTSPSGSDLRDISNRQRTRQESSSSAFFARKLRKRMSLSQLGTADYHRDLSDPFMGAGILPSSEKLFFPQLFDAIRIQRSRRKTSGPYAKQNVKIVEQHPTGIFGVPLRQSITYANVAISLVDADGKSYIYGYVPIVVAKCGVYLKEKATNVEGIFRLSGSEKRIKELKTVFDSPDRYGKGLDWAGYTVHDAANVLRRYLNLLPEPIVPLDLYDRFREPLRGHTKQAVGDSEGPQVDGNFDVAAAIVTYQQLITELPPLNRQLLLYILDLLAVFASKSDENRMNSQNLAAIFQPGMLSHPDHDMAPIEYRLSQDVLIFLIENQDHFLIGMRGTAADEQTVQEVQSGGTTPTKNKTTIGRSASNASAGADSVRKFGGIRRNVSVSSRNSRQSNGAPSPATPTYGTPMQGVGVHRSNTVPSARSPGLPQGRLQKQSGSPSPTAGIADTSSQSTAPRGISPSAPPAAANRNASPAPRPGVVGTSSLASTGTSRDRLLVDPERQPEAVTPSRERAGFFQRSPTGDSDRKQPNKLRKKRIPSSSNPSAQSSTHSLHGRTESVSPALIPTNDIQDLIPLEPIMSNPSHANDTSSPVATDTPRAEQFQPFQPRSQEAHKSSDSTLKPTGSPESSMHSRSSFNEQSDLDHIDDPVTNTEQTEKRSRWRLSRRRERDDSQQQNNVLSPPKGLGSDNAGASSSSVGSSSRPRKSFTGDTVPAALEATLVGAQLQPSNESGTPPGAGEEKKKSGPIGWLKTKMKEREDKEAERERNKTPAPTERSGFAMPTRGKSMEVKREDNPILDEPVPQPQR